MTVFTANSPYVCNWTTDECCSTLNDADPALAQDCVNAAAEILYGLSGRQFGLCEVTVRPCRKVCCDECDFTGPRWTPVLMGGQWTNVACGKCGDTCSCPEVCEVMLPGPVDSIIEVKLDGVSLGQSLYRVDNRNSLVRLKGSPLRIPLGNKVLPYLGISNPGLPDDRSTTPDGILLPTNGTNYQFTTGGSYADLYLEVQVPLAGGSFNVFGVQGVVVEAVSGGAPITVVGSLVTVGGVTRPDEQNIVRVRTAGGGLNNTAFGIQVNSGPATLMAIQVTTPECMRIQSGIPAQPEVIQLTELDARWTLTTTTGFGPDQIFAWTSGAIATTGLTPLGLGVYGWDGVSVAPTADVHGDSCIQSIRIQDFLAPFDNVVDAQHAEIGQAPYTFPAPAVIGAPFVTSDWNANNTRIRVRLVAGDPVTVDSDGTFHFSGNDSQMQVCYDRRTPAVPAVPASLVSGDDCLDDCWPTCQDMTADCDQPNTWCVTYLRGNPVPAAGIKALSELACELCKACIGDSSCCLPKRVTQITRQGISMTLLDPMTFLENGRTGLYLVDAWLQSVNPKSLARNAGVYSPDYIPSRETTWP